RPSGRRRRAGREVPAPRVRAPRAAGAVVVPRMSGGRSPRAGAATPAASGANVLNVCALGPTRYRDGLALMDALVAARAAGETGDWLLYPDHEPVLTVGRSPSEGSVHADPAMLARAGLEVIEVPRGGDVTWHGPGQLVGYPVVALDRVGRDLHRWLR